MAICGVDCCKDCNRANECGGCEKTNGHPFGGNCIAAKTIKQLGMDNYNKLKVDLIKEINALNIDGLKVNDLNLLNGFYVNLEYPLANGNTVKFLNDTDIYLGNQIELNNDRCYGVICNEEFIIVAEYGTYGVNPKLIEYKKRF